VTGPAALSSWPVTMPALGALVGEGVLSEGSATLGAGSAPVARFWVQVAEIHDGSFLVAT
jgi:hypothetical protein